MNKKFTILTAALALLTILAVPIGMRADEASYVFNTDAGIAALGISKPSSGAGTSLSTDPYVVGQISMVAAHGSTDTRVWNSSGTLDLRIYKNGGSLTFSAATGYNITGITITGGTVNVFSVNVGTYTDSSGSWSNGTDGATSVTFTATGTGKINTITVTYTSTGGGGTTHALSFGALPVEGGSVTVGSDDSGNITLAEGATPTVTATANTGYAFSNWTVSGTGSDVASTTSASTTFTMGTEDATLTANFTTVTTHTVTYKANGGTGSDIVNAYNEGTDVTVAANTFSYEGHAFTKWNTAADGSGTNYLPGATIENISANIDLYAQWEESITDHLTYTLIGVTGTTYTEWNGKTSNSDAVYAGKTAGGNNSIQLNGTTTNGIKSTTSGGLVRNVTITWNSNTATSGRKIIVYGSNEPLTGMTSSNQLGEINRNETSLDITGDYAYIGIVGNGGACYLDDIYITWESVVAPTVATPTFNVDGIGSGDVFVGTASVTITAPDYNTHYIYYTTDGTDPDDSSTLYDGTAISVSTVGTTTIKAIAYDGDLNESAIGSIEVTIVETTDISDVYAATDDNSTYYYIEGIITYISGSSMYVEDNTGGILVYGTNTGCAVGNDVVIKGTKTTYNSLPEFQNITILDNDGQTNALPETAINISQVADYMFRRVKFTQVLVGTTSSSLTTISQGDNNVGVYNIPVIENVTEEGYYLKTITGVVASYSGNTQLYVASADDITIYDVDASSNNTTLGTVTTNGYMVIATPASGATYDDPAYVVVTEATTNSVAQTGNNFKVVTNGDLAIEIQFVTSSSPCTVTYHVNGTIGSFSGYETKYQNSTIGELPTTEGVGGLTFAGWSTSESTINIIDGTYEIGAVATLDLYAVYSRTITETSEQVVILDGDASNLTGTAQTVTMTENGFEYYASSAKYQAVQTGAENYFTNNRAILIGKKNANLHNVTAFGEGITKFEVYSNLGASTSVEVGINFSSTGITEYDATADNTWTATLSTEDHVYDASEELPADAKYFWYQVTSSHNSQVQFRITYNSTTSTTNYYTRVFFGTASAPIDITGPSIIPSGYTLDMGNNALTNSFDASKLIIEDGGQLKTPNEVYATVEKNITGYGDANFNTNKGYYLISAPAEKYLAIDTQNPDPNVDAYHFDASQDEEWQNFKTATGAWHIAANSAVLYASKNDCTLSLDGYGIVYNHPNTGANVVYNKVPATNADVNVDVVFNSGKTFQGFNLIGNPFTCTAYLADGRDFYRMNTAGDGLIINTDAQGGGNAINVCEGIFVVTTNSENEVTFTTTEPPVTSTGNNGMVNISVAQVVNSRDAQPSADYARVRINNGENMTKFVFNENTSRIYIPQNGKDYAVIRSEARGEMPVNFKAAETGTYTISVEAENLDMNYLHLIDNMTGADVDLLANPSYTFDARTSDYASRFRLVFSANDENGASTGSATFAYFNGSEWVVNSNGNATLQVVDVMGRVLSSETVNGNHTMNLNLSTGVYMLRLVNGNDVKTQKIVVR